MNYYLQGLIMGLAYLAPIGMQNLFVINTALTQKRSKSFLTALIVIFFDVTLALACFFGIGTLIEHYKWLELIILLAGSIIVIYIGVQSIRSSSTLETSEDISASLTKTISTACFVTWFNPQAVIDGTMMLGAFRVTLPETKAAIFVFGVTSASVIWFLSLSMLIALFRNKLNNKLLRIINIICGAIIIFYGIKLFYNFINITFL